MNYNKKKLTLEQMHKNPPMVKVKGVPLINFGAVIKEELNDPEFKKMVEMEVKKLDTALAVCELRQRKKISQAQLAAKVGMKQSAIGRIESGEQNLTLETLCKIAHALDKKLEVTFV
jgi:DNA-binding XRE family transcriptional regulator